MVGSGRDDRNISANCRALDPQKRLLGWTAEATFHEVDAVVVTLFASAAGAGRFEQVFVLRAQDHCQASCAGPQLCERGVDLAAAA